MTLTIAAAALLAFAPTGKTTQAATHDYQASYRYAHTWAKKYRHQRDHLQTLLARKVRENQTLRRRLAGVRHAVRHRPDVVEAIRLAATAYHVDFGLLYRRAMCETGGSLNPYSKNRNSTASGVFQFLYDAKHPTTGGTWGTTPYARESVWSPYANSLAAAWMQANGRGGEWVCRG